MKFRYIASTLLLGGLLAGGVYIANAAGDNPVNVSAPQPAVPPNIVTSANKPMLMLATSKDHTLFGPIYTDFEDIDDDGVLDTTFRPKFKYYGYFDSTKCYTYSTTDKRFNPSGRTSLSDADAPYACTAGSSLWSGNFLNWATMSRIDVVRKMLYGGKRSTDGLVGSGGSASVTVLERVNLSQDSHSFVKHYWGNDIASYTPFSRADLTKKSIATNDGYAGLTICNRSDQMSEGGNPVIRLAKGNYKMWATTNGTVCQWKSESGSDFGNKLARYFLDADKGNGGIAHEVNRPTVGTDDAAKYGGNELTVRVRVCDPQNLGEERCQAFPAGATNNYKPYGIFQEFGLESASTAGARAEFGVITGSYDNNLTAGALRKNIGDFSDEINVSNGTFKGTGAIKAMDSFVLFGRSAGTNYGGSANQLPVEMRDGILPAWGNPVGEMVAQALRYFAKGSSTNPTTTTNDGKSGLDVVTWKDPLASDTNRDRLYGNPLCRPMYTLALSSSALSFDEQSANQLVGLPNSIDYYVNQVGGNEGISNTVRSVGSINGGWGETCSGKTVGNLSDATGVCPEAPAIKGTWQVAGAALYANTSKIRNTASMSNVPADIAKVQDALKVKTLAASLSGGVARIEVPIPNSNPRKYVYITGESLWNNNNRAMPGAMLTFQAINSGNNTQGMPYGTFVVTWNDALFGGDYDMDITGFIRYDILNATGGGYNIRVTTDILNVGAGFTGTHGFSIVGTDKDGRYLTHRHLNAEDPIKNADGYLCKGNTTQGRCSTSKDSMNVYDANYPYSLDFKMVGVDDVLLQDPLWYAAKYGYFSSSKKDQAGNYVDMSVADALSTIKNDKDSWDHLKADGTPGSDGVPDGYFLARRPELLESQLRKALEAMAKTSNAAPALSSTVTTEDSMKYTVSFDTSTISGELSAYKMQSNGTYNSTPTWYASGRLKALSAGNGNNRKIITNDGTRPGGGGGVAFRWASLSADYKVQMTTASPYTLSVANAEIALNYVRGDQSKEGTDGLRVRGENVLGPIINSTPRMQNRPLANFFGNVAAGYASFYDSQKNRKKLVWVGANDGMLHAFDSATGDEAFAYVPGVLANRLAEIPLQRGNGVFTKLNGNDFVETGGTKTLPETVRAYVDGNPYTADIKLGNANSTSNTTWKTYAFSSLGRGGKAVFALDVTNPSSLSESNAASIFKWQFSSADDADMGYVTGSLIKNHPSSNQASPIAVMNNGKFAMIIGNGQKSTTGKAVLYILFMDGPTGSGWGAGTYKKIVVDDGSGNGLSTPRWEDIDGDGTADVIYAGDLKGNVWKFDVTDGNADNWKPAFGAAATGGGVAQPLFTATYDQSNGAKAVLPITTAPELTYMGLGGMVVTVGTGNAFVGADFPKNDVVQRVFGVWDRGAPVTTLRPLVRSFSRASDGTVTLNSDTSSQATMSWNTGGTGGYNAWVAVLPGTGEAVLADPSFDAGVLWFITTRPKTQTNQCSDMPDTSIYTLDPISGRPERPSLGMVTVGGQQVYKAGADFSDPQGILSRPRINPNETKTCVAGTPGCVCTGSNCTRQDSLCGPGQRAVNVVGSNSTATMCYSMTPRLQWREIPGVRTK